MTWQNWRLCMSIYEKQGAITYHDHMDRDHKPGNWAVRQDLARHNCRMILGPYWAE